MAKWRIRKASDEFATAFLDAPIQLNLASGTAFDMPVVNIASLLQHCASESASFRNLLPTTLRQFPCSPAAPWDFTLHFDEFVPGNVLRQDNKRKTLSFYGSFRSFGPDAVSCEDAWLPLAFVRHTVVDQVAGKMSGVVRQLLRRLFIGPDSASQRGTLIDGIGPGGAPALIFFKLSNLLYDEDGAKNASRLKGAAGVIPCALRKNVHGIYDHSEPLLSAHDRTSTLVPISCSEPNLFDARAAEDLFFSADLLQRLQATLPKGAFEEQCKVHGVNHVPDGLLLDAEFRQHASLDMRAYDPARCVIINGIAQIELSGFLCRLAAVGLTLERFRDIASAQWQTCSFSATSGMLDANGLFSDQRQKHLQTNKKYSAKASEFIAAVPLIRYALDVLTAGSAQFKLDFAKELASFAALAKSIFLYLLAKRGAAVADAWTVALRDHAVAFESAHGDCGMHTPKFHFCRHLPRQEGGNVALIVQELHFICQALPSASRWRKDDAPKFAQCDSFMAQPLWTQEASGTLSLVDMA
ncbi:unnamed protein product [Prorocentrum cordatum]|uniref:Uncharacterized protein n=1 Tax=Prorocentrum cordatum TaxID=2364126 RepID=A0ABN9TLC9_9DINO|nr:unnamed protein product [Polarella glacialis]